MKRIAATIALGAGLSVGIAPETPDMFAEAAHIPPRACRAEIVQAFGESALLNAIKIDVENAIDADRPTRRENNRKIDPETVRMFPRIDQFLAQSEIVLERQVLPESGFVLNLHRIDNSWPFHADTMDDIIRQTLSNVFEDDPLRTATYQCYLREIFSNGALRGMERDIYLIGEGTHCIGIDRIAPREPGHCTARGRERKDIVLILPSDPIAASAALAHEYGHAMQRALDVRPGIDKYREHFAGEIGDISRDIMSKQNVLIFEDTSN